MDILKITVLAFFACLVWLLLKGTQPDFGFLISAAACACILFWLLGAAEPYLVWLKELSGFFLPDSFSVLLKCLALALIAQLACAFCKDAGQEALGAAAELCGRVLVLLSALPLLRTVLAELLRLLA